MQSFAASLLATCAFATSLTNPAYEGPKLPYYKNKVIRTTSDFNFTRLVPITVVEKYYHAHSDASDSSDVDSLASDHDSHYSDDCPFAYDCTDSSDYSLHSSDDSAGVTSHDHDHGYYGYDYFYSDTDSHYDDLHAHLRVTERYQEVPETFTQQKLTYVRIPRAREETTKTTTTATAASGSARHYITKADPWTGTDPYPNWGPWVGQTGSYYQPRDGPYMPRLNPAVTCVTSPTTTSCTTQT